MLNVNIPVRTFVLSRSIYQINFVLSGSIYQINFCIIVGVMPTSTFFSVRYCTPFVFLVNAPLSSISSRWRLSVPHHQSGGWLWGKLRHHIHELGATDKFSKSRSIPWLTLTISLRALCLSDNEIPSQTTRYPPTLLSNSGQLDSIYYHDSSLRFI